MALNKTELGLVIRQYRLAKNYSMRKLAEKINVTYSTIYKYEKGLIIDIPENTLKKIIDILNIPKHLIPLHTEKDIRQIDSANTNFHHLLQKYVHQHIKIGEYGISYYLLNASDLTPQDIKQIEQLAMQLIELNRFRCLTSKCGYADEMKKTINELCIKE